MRHVVKVFTIQFPRCKPTFTFSSSLLTISVPGSLMIPSSSSAPPPAPDAAAIGSSSSIRTESGMESTGLDWG